MAKVRLASILEEQPVSMGDNTGGDPPGKGVKVSVKKTEPEDPDYLDIKDTKNLKSGKYKKEHIQNFIKAAKAAGVEPNQLLSLVWQESNFGGTKQQILDEQKRRATISASGGRPGRGGNQTNLGQITGVDNPEELAALSGKTGIDTKYLAPALILRDKLKYAKQLGFNDPAMQLQAYNGYGKLKMAPGDKYYGQSFPQGGVLNMRETPLYGKRLLDLTSDIKKNKEIQSLINGE